jgi:hypothetical protein
MQIKNLLIYKAKMRTYQFKTESMKIYFKDKLEFRTIFIESLIIILEMK